MLLFIALIIVVILKKKRTAGSGDTKWPYYAKKPLSSVEQILFHRLTSSLPDHIILAQVQLSQILGVEKGANFGIWHNKINRMSVDFLICQKDSTILAAIELDDKTHLKQSRVEADTKKDKALTDAGVKLIRWQAGSLPDNVKIQKELLGIGQLRG